MMRPTDHLSGSPSFSFKAKQQENGSFRVECATNPKIVGVGPDLQTAVRAASKAAYDFVQNGDQVP